MRAVLSLSGGLDSAVLLANTAEQTKDILCVSFKYGSLHNQKEMHSAEALAEHYSADYLRVDLTEPFLHINSGLLHGDIPEGHYSDESMRRTVVPGRNTIFAAVLTGIAQSCAYDYVLLANHAGDAYTYPDCRRNWMYSMRGAIYIASEGYVSFDSPFINYTKSEIVQLGLRLNVPFEKTWSCYRGSDLACGRCGSCLARLEAFRRNRKEDPIEYETN